MDYFTLLKSGYLKGFKKKLSLFLWQPLIIILTSLTKRKRGPLVRLIPRPGVGFRSG